MSLKTRTTVLTQFVEANGVRFAHKARSRSAYGTTLEQVAHPSRTSKML